MESAKNPKGESTLRGKTARTFKWNAVDRLLTQVVYAAVGVVLANLLGKEDFGLVGVLLVFQAFAILFVDSGFGAALLQKQAPTESDYSTVFWFNLGVSVVVYFALWFCAPAIATLFGDARLIDLSRVMFITFILNGLGIVQTNRLMKAMDVKQVAVGNVVGLTAGGALGVGLALGGYGAWALVWQSVASAGIKSGWLWAVTRWRPAPVFSRESLRSVWRVGLGVFSSSFLNTLFLNIYSFVIGAWYSLGALGIYTQADKWSKMGYASLMQILTSTFVPVLSQFQNDGDAYRTRMRQINRFSWLLALPAMLGLVVIAAPLFHLLFGNKWDAAIPLFRLLAARGVFIIMVSVCTNYLLALGYAKSLVVVEAVKDGATVAALLATIWFKTVEALVWGQFIASGATWIIVMALTSRRTGYGFGRFLADGLPMLGLNVPVLIAAWLATALLPHPWLQLTAAIATAAILYPVLLRLLRLPEYSLLAPYLRKLLPAPR